MDDEEKAREVEEAFAPTIHIYQPGVGARRAGKASGVSVWCGESGVPRERCFWGSPTKSGMPAGKICERCSMAQARSRARRALQQK